MYVVCLVWTLSPFLLTLQILTHVGTTASCVERESVLMDPATASDPRCPLLFMRHAYDENGKAMDFKWYSYNEIWEMVQDFASGLIHLNILSEIEGVAGGCCRLTCSTELSVCTAPTVSSGP